ncbi:MAG: hypothetical protein KJN98_03860 [Pontiella sp.]|nr:hypothetical protein [Pontiella sp.]
MPTARLTRVLFAWLGLFSAAYAADVEIPKEVLDEPFDIRATRLEYVNDTLVADGGVTGRFENAIVSADRLTGNTETGDLHIEGNIVVERGKMLWQGSELDYNYLTQIGNFGPSTLNYDPVVLTVDEVEKVSTNEYRLRGANFTTCPKPQPHLQARAGEARLVDDQYLIARGVKLYVGKVPVLYVPYWRQNLDSGIFSLDGGYGSEWGAHLLVNATVPLSSRIDSLTDVNLYGKRGVGMGQGFDWAYPEAKGSFEGFYIRDEDPYSKYDSASDKLLIDDDRYRLRLDHLQYFTDTHYINTRMNYLSDPAVTEEFFKQEYRRSAQPENYASWTYGNGTVGSEGFINYRLNDFYNNTDRFEYSLDVYRTRIAGTPFYLQSENAVASLDQVRAETNLVAGAAYDAGRIDSMNTLLWPQRWGFLNVVPRATYRATYYSENVVGDDVFRQIPGAGVEVSFQAAKVLSERERWYGKGLRHKIEPYTDYIFTDVSEATNNLPVFDRVDPLVDEDRLKLGLRNVLQTKRNGRTARFLDVDLYTYYLLEKQGAEDDFDSLFLDARMPLSERMLFDVEGEYDWNNGSLPFLNSRFSYEFSDVIVDFEHLYRDNLQSLWTSQFNLFPGAKWSLDGYVRYNDNENDLEEFGATGYFNWCCMRYGVGYRYYGDEEHRVVFSFSLSAYPESARRSRMF